MLGMVARSKKVLGSQENLAGGMDEHGGTREVQRRLAVVDQVGG
jgi:hypothetical protein